MRKRAKSLSSNARVTVFVYLGILLAVAAVAVYSGRHVLFQPWSARISMSLAASEPSSGPVIYAVGGRRAGETLLEDILRFSPNEGALDEWARLDGASVGCAAVAVEDVLYVIGGSDGAAPSDAVRIVDGAQRAQGSVEEFARLPAPRSFGAAAVVSETALWAERAPDGAAQDSPRAPVIYYLGGWDGERKSNAVFRIEPKTRYVERVAALPEPRERLGAAVVDGTIYVLGGYGPDNEGSDRLWRFAPETGTVEDVGALPEVVDRVSVVSHRGYLVYMTPAGNTESELHRVAFGEGEIAHSAFRVPLSAYQVRLVATEEHLYAVGGAHPEFERQIGLWRIELGGAQAGVTPLRLRSAPWN